ncbi:CBS domain-containing protein [Thiohalorhabdus methylotrophus]|uniref:CBS domain-containing protein n=1 Tax=Thiohalorhabdus methylotrophus TaxID=3242694 RepID=A0ABV4TU36_9GAMM
MVESYEAFSLCIRAPGNDTDQQQEVEMEIREIMTTEYQWVTPATPIQEAAQLMRDQNIGMLPVFEGQKLIGTVTDRDITTRCVANGVDPQSTHVNHAMTRDVVHCFEDDDLQAAAKLMEEHQVRRLLIYNRSEEPVGIVAHADLARNPEASGLAGEVLQDVSEPGPSHRPTGH